MRLLSSPPFFVIQLAVVLSGCARRPETLQDSVARAIADSVTTLETAMNRAVDSTDCDRGLSYIGDQAPLFVSGAHVVDSHQQLLQACQAMVAPRTGAHFTTDRVHAYALSLNAAYVVREGRYAIDYRDGHQKTERLVMTTIWNRGPTGWRLVHLHESANSQDSTVVPARPAR
jgi:ketosteroid isomerase-like protein